MSTLPTDQPSRTKPATVAITAHRLFPAIVALWFAALLGIGSLAIAPEMLSALVGALGIAKVIPAAAPPLGFTARGLLALAMGGVGVIVGMMIGSRIARPQPVQPLRKTDPTRGWQEGPTRDYAYGPDAHREEAAPEPELHRAPRGPLRASEAFADIEPLTDAAAVPHEQRSLADKALASESLSEDDFAALGAPREDLFHEPDDATLHSVDPEPAPSLASPAAFATLGERRDPDARRSLGQATLASLGTVQLVERLALAMASATQAPRHPATKDGLTDTLCRDAVPHPEGSAPAAEAPLELDTIAPDTSPYSREPRFVAPTEHQAAAHPHGAPEAWSAPDVSDIQPHQLPDSIADGQVTPTPATASAHQRPSILDPIAHGWDDEPDEDDEAPTLAPPRFLSTYPATVAASASPSTAGRRNASADRLPSGGRTAPRRGESDAVPAEALDDGGAEVVNDDRYPSLLDIQPLARESIRIPAPADASSIAPVPEARQSESIVMFPTSRVDAPFAPPPASTLQSRRSPPFQPPIGAGLLVKAPELPADPVDADDADRALRAALATLQRMSGGR